MPWNSAYLESLTIVLPLLRIILIKLIQHQYNPNPYPDLDPDSDPVQSLSQSLSQFLLNHENL